MATVQIRVDDTLKQKADALYSIQEAIADSTLAYVQNCLHQPYEKRY